MEKFGAYGSFIGRKVECILVFEWIGWWPCLEQLIMHFLTNDNSEDYNWSHDYHLNESLDNAFGPYHEISDPHSYFPIDFPNKLPAKPEAATEDGLDVFRLFGYERQQHSQEIDILSEQPSLPEKSAVPVTPIPPPLPTLTGEIDISMNTLCSRIRTMKGDRFQTKNLCKHLHTETSNFLKKWIIINRPSKEQVELAKAFCAGGSSIDNFKVLFKNPKICKLCRDYYESKFFVQEIMSSNMDLKTKLMILKYMKKICQLTFNKEFKSWKQEKEQL